MQASRFGLLDSVRSNASMASVLCSYHALTGSWKNLFTDLEATENLSKDTIREVAARTFTDSNSFLGLVLPQSRVPASAPAL
jgi:predicted Zn-dependent peptidase